MRNIARGELTDEVQDAENLRDYEAKVAVLGRKVGQLVMELDLLKKSRDTTGRRAAIDRLRAAGCTVRLWKQQCNDANPALVSFITPIREAAIILQNYSALAYLIPEQFELKHAPQKVN